MRYLLKFFFIMSVGLANWILNIKTIKTNKMKKVTLILIALAMTTMSFSQSLAKLSNYKTDSVTGLPLQEIVTNFYIDWGVNQSSNLDSTSQIIIVNIKQFVMSPDTTKVIIQRNRSLRIKQGTDDFNRWFNSFEEFGMLIYQELIKK